MPVLPPAGSPATSPAELPERLGGARRPEESYGGLRNRLQTGDVLCFRGRGVYSWLIRQLTRSAYSHAGLVFRYEERVYCLEAVGSGVRIILMSLLKRQYAGGIEVFEPSGATPAARQSAVGFAFQQLGRPYDLPGILRFLALILFGRRKRIRPDRNWFCSELVAEAWRRQGLSLSGANPAYTSPQDLASSPALRFVATIKKS